MSAGKIRGGILFIEGSQGKNISFSVLFGNILFESVFEYRSDNFKLLF